MDMKQAIVSNPSIWWWYYQYF